MKAALVLVLATACAQPAPAVAPTPPAPVTPRPSEPEPEPEAAASYVPLAGPIPPAENPAEPVAKPTKPAGPSVPSPAEKRACAARGGKLQPVCMGGIIECIVRYRDAGKRCTDKKDCTGECLLLGAGPAPAPGTPTTGTCQETNDACGCAARVAGGKVTGMDCLD